MPAITQRLDPLDDRKRTDNKSLRKYRLPAFEIEPRRCLPPLEFSFGTIPIQALMSRPDLKTWGSGTLATKALATSGPKLGIASSLLLMLFCRCQASTRRSASKIWHLISSSCDASAMRQSRAVVGTRSSSPLRMSSSNTSTRCGQCRRQYRTRQDETGSH